MSSQKVATTELGESVVEEVRAIRAAIDSEAGHDLRKLAEQARRVSEEVRKRYGMKVAELPIAAASLAGHARPSVP